jgi:hypothetical protein
MTIAGICELVLETDDVEPRQGFCEGLGLGRLLKGMMALAEGGGGA